MPFGIPSKLKPAPLKYPNGGGLQSMANKKPESQKLEFDALEAKHKVEVAKLKEKHSKVNAPKPMTLSKKPAHRPQGR